MIASRLCAKLQALPENIPGCYASESIAATQTNLAASASPLAAKPREFYAGSEGFRQPRAQELRGFAVGPSPGEAVALRCIGRPARAAACRCYCRRCDAW